ncbi:hypothetical protein Tco_0170201 [Tanacetum coccineum]
MLYSGERPRISRPRFASQVDEKNDLSKTVTPHYLPKVRESAAANTSSPREKPHPPRSVLGGKPTVEFYRTVRLSGYLLESAVLLTQVQAEEEAVAREVHATYARIMSGPDPEPMQEDQTGSNSGKLHVSLAGPNPEHMDDEFLVTAYPKCKIGAEMSEVKKTITLPMFWLHQSQVPTVVDKISRNKFDDALLTILNDNTADLNREIHCAAWLSPSRIKNLKRFPKRIIRIKREQDKGKLQSRLKTTRESMIVMMKEDDDEEKPFSWINPG